MIYQLEKLAKDISEQKFPSEKIHKKNKHIKLFNNTQFSSV